jgi:hypothetical protein
LDVLFNFFHLGLAFACFFELLLRGKGFLFQLELGDLLFLLRDLDLDIRNLSPGTVKSG